MIVLTMLLPDRPGSDCMLPQGLALPKESMCAHIIDGCYAVGLC